jgi:hypothetical protein
VLWGFVPVLVVAGVIHHLINRLEAWYAPDDPGDGHAA